MLLTEAAFLVIFFHVCLESLQTGDEEEEENIAWDVIRPDLLHRARERNVTITFFCDDSYETPTGQVCGSVFSVAFWCPLRKLTGLVGVSSLETSAH